jgi:hypothetical protein
MNEARPDAGRIRVLRTLMVAAWVSLVSTNAAAQLSDTIIRIDGEDLPSPAAVPYFNAQHCADPEVTLYDLAILEVGSPATQVYLWAGVENAGCEQAANRTDLTGLCGEVLGNPYTVSSTGTVADLSLGNLVNSGVVDCDNTALEGVPSWLYAFRNSDPGSSDIESDRYGIASFVVDVTAPRELVLTSAAEQTGLVFTISWETPIDSPSIAQYNLYANDTDDPEGAFAAGPVSTAGQNAVSIAISSDALSLDPDDEVYLYVSAVDNASAQPGDGNEGSLSNATKGVAENPPDGGVDAGVDGSVPPDGGGGSGGCSVSTHSPAHAAASAIALLLLASFVRRYRSGRRLASGRANRSWATPQWRSRNAPSQDAR